MVVNNYQFEDVLRQYYNIELFSGYFVVRRKSRIKKLEKLSKISPKIFVIVTVLMIYGTPIFKNLLSFIIAVSRVSEQTLIHSGVYLLMRDPAETNKFFDWCAKMYNFKTEFHPKIQVIACKKIQWIHCLSLKMLTWLHRSLLLAGFNITLGITIIGYFLPDDIYPAFSIPLPFYLPFKDQETWIAYITTTLVDTALEPYLISTACIGYGFTYLISFYIFAYLEIIKESILLMKKELNDKIVDHTIKWEKKEDLEEFHTFIKFIVKMICDVNGTANNFNSLLSPFFLLTELACYTCVFTFCLLLVVVKEQLAYGTSNVTVVLILTIFLCFISERMKDKVSSLDYLFYDLPWYALRSKERSVILQAMACRNFTPGFTAGLFHSLGHPRFVSIVKSSYSNCLVLKNLVLKKG